MINIIIADHQAIFRAGIAKILAVEDDLRIVGQPKSLEQLVNCLEKLRSRVLVISSRFTSDLSTIQSLAQRSEHTSAKPKACPSPDPDHMNAHDRVCGFVRDTTMSQSRVAQ